MGNQNDQWVAAYYPLDVISNPRSRAILCLLFDKIIYHFPISSMSCGGGTGVSSIILEDDILVKEGVIEAREEYLFGNIEADFSTGEPWGTSEEFNNYYQLQITAMAVDVCEREGIVPISDSPSYRVPASFLENIDLSRFAYFQASMLAIQSLEIALPPIADIQDSYILEAREKLRDQLIPFRRAMMTLAPTIRNGVQSNATILNIQNEAKYVVQTQIAPALGELKDRLQKEKGKFWRNLLLKGGFIIPRFVLNYVAEGALKATIEIIDDTKELATSATDFRNILSSLKRNGGFGFLLALPDTPLCKPKERPQRSS